MLLCPVHVVVMPKAQLCSRSEKFMFRGLLFVSHQLMREVVVLTLQAAVDLRGCGAFAVLLSNQEKAPSMNSCEALQGAAWNPGRNRKYGEGTRVVAFTMERMGEIDHFVCLETMREKNLADRTYWPKFRESLAEG